MDRLTIPDEPIEGGMRRAVVDARAVKEQAMTLYWKLKKYEDTGLEPDEIKELKEKQIPKNVPDIEHFGRCPECDTEFNSELLNEYNIMFCPWCGQALNWTEN